MVHTYYAVGRKHVYAIATPTTQVNTNTNLVHYQKLDWYILQTLTGVLMFNSLARSL